MTKKYLSLERLAEYDALLKAKIAEDDAAILAQAKTDASTQDAVVFAEAQKGINNVQVAVDTLSASIDGKLNGKSDTNHNHDDSYDIKGTAADALAQAKAYTDNKTSGIATTTVMDDKVNAHNTSTTAHSDIRDLISALSTKVNNFLDVDDTTTDELSEVLELINNNKGTLESLTSGKVNVSDIVDNLTTANAAKVLSANQGVVLKGLIDSLQETIDGKADTVHTHEEYATRSSAAILEATIMSALDGKSDTGHTHQDATTSASGFMSAADKEKLDGIEAGAKQVVVDSTLSTSSTNPVQNKVVATVINSAVSAITANTDSISAHTTAIANLQAVVDEIQEITSEEIHSLFANNNGVSYENGNTGSY